MNTRDIIRLVPWDTIKSVLAIDAKVMSTQPDKFVQENMDNYDIALNTWMISMRDFAPYTWPSVLQYIVHHGLCGAIAFFKANASIFIADDTQIERMDPLARSLYNEISKHFSVRSLLTVNYCVVDHPSAIFLFLCRFLKRMTPQCADLLDKGTVSSFWINQKRLKEVCRTGYNELILQLIRDEVKRSPLKDRVNKFRRIRMCDIELSPGTCYSLDGKHGSSLEFKYATLAREIGYNVRYERDTIIWKYSDVWDKPKHAYLMTVPKTFHTARTIAPEECVRQSVAHRMFTLCKDNTYPGINLHDQSINQKMALQGSLDGKWATIDLSHASDDVTWSLISSIYADNYDYATYLDQIRPQYLYSEGKERLLHSFATMGNSMTFLVESEVFWLITRAAVHFAQRHGEACCDDVYVYGDDIICDSSAYPYVVAFLEKLGFKVNQEKSFHTGSYRESCGKEYINGIDVTGPYFPRSPLKSLLTFSRQGRESRLETSFQSLIALQQRLFQVSPSAAQYVEFYLRDRTPHPLGTKELGTQDEVMWGYADVPSAERYRKTPYAKEVQCESPWYFDKVNKRWGYNKERCIRVGTSVSDLEVTPMYWRSRVEVSPGKCDPELTYCHYLEQGPYYATDIDRLLGVSTSRFNIRTGTPISKWVLEP